MLDETAQRLQRLDADIRAARERLVAEAEERRGRAFQAVVGIGIVATLFLGPTLIATILGALPGWRATLVAASDTGSGFAEEPPVSVELDTSTIGPQRSDPVVVEDRFGHSASASCTDLGRRQGSGLHRLRHCAAKQKSDRHSCCSSAASV